MKKIKTMIAAVALSASAMAANNTAGFLIGVEAPGNAYIYDEMIFAENEAYSPEFENLKDADKLENGSANIVFYGYVDSRKCGTIATNNLDGTLLTLETVGETDYDISFYNVTGTNTYYLIDLVSNESVQIAEGNTLELRGVATNSTLTNRFVISKINASPYQVTTNEDGWASFACTADVAPADPSLAVYKGALNNSDPENPAIVLTAVTTGIPAGEGVFVHGASLTTYNFSATTATAFSGNDLVGCTAATDPAGISDAIYTLRNVGGVTGLYNYVGTAAIPAGKAYLPIPVSSSSAPARVRMVINGAQGIEEVQGDNVPCTKFVEDGQVFIRRGNEVYNLQGQIVK